MEWHALVRDDTQREVREYSIVSATQPVPNMYRVWSGALRMTWRRSSKMSRSVTSRLFQRESQRRMFARDILARPVHFKLLRYTRGTTDYCDFRNFRDLPWPNRLSIRWSDTCCSVATCHLHHVYCGHRYTQTRISLRRYLVVGTL